MAGEFGGPPGIPEFSAPKDDDSSEKKKSVFGFRKRSGGEDEATKAAAAHAETDDDDDEKDGNWFRMLSKKFGGSVAVGEVENTDQEATNTESEEDTANTTAEATEQPVVETVEVSPYSFAEEVPAEVEQGTVEGTAAPVQEATPDMVDDASEDEEPELEDSTIEPSVEDNITLPTAEKVDEIPASAEVEEEPEVVEPAPASPPPILPNLPAIEAPMEMPEDEPEDEVDDTTVTPNDGGGAPAGTLHVQTPAPEVLPPAPDVTSNTNNALPAVALGVGLYAHHRINKANRESEKQMKNAQQEAATMHKEQLLQQKVAREQAAWNPNTAPTTWAPQSAEVQPKSPQPEKTDKKPPTPEKTHVPEQKEAPRVETKKPEVVAVKEQIETTTPSVGDVLAERKTQLKTPEVVVAKTPEQQPSDSLLKPELSDPIAEINLKQIEALAEQAVAIEEQFERQHEAKDVSSTPDYWASSGAGQHVDVDQLFQKDDPSVGVVPVSATAQPTTTRQSLDLNDPLNQYAMRMGVVTAALIIIAVMLWSIVA